MLFGIFFMLVKPTHLCVSVSFATFVVGGHFTIKGIEELYYSYRDQIEDFLSMYAYIKELQA